MLYIVEMPEINSCKDCKLKTVSVGHGECIEYCGLKVSIFCDNNKKPDDCPLVKISGPVTIQDLNDLTEPRKVSMSIKTYEKLGGNNV